VHLWDEPGRLKQASLSRSECTAITVHVQIHAAEGRIRAPLCYFGAGCVTLRATAAIDLSRKSEKADCEAALNESCLRHRVALRREPYAQLYGICRIVINVHKGLGRVGEFHDRVDDLLGGQQAALKHLNERAVQAFEIPHRMFA
jgi:hypothetical protein